MEHIGLTQQQRQSRRLTAGAYGVMSTRSRRQLAQNSSEQIAISARSNLFTQKLTQRKHNGYNNNSNAQKFQKISEEVHKLEELKQQLEVKNTQLENTIEHKIRQINQLQNTDFNEQTHKIQKLQIVISEKDAEIERLNNQVIFERIQKGQTLESTLEEMSVIRGSSDIEETEEKLHELMTECIELRKEIEFQSQNLFTYQQKLLREKMQKAEILFMLEQKQKLIENLMKDRENVLKQSCSYALSNSIVDDLVTRQQKSFAFNL